MVEIKIYREAKITDRPQLKSFAAARSDSRLANLIQLPDSDFEALLNGNGRMWICEIDNRLVGLALVDLEEKTSPVIHVHPRYEKLGIGSKLNDLMLKLYSKNTTQKDFA